MRITRWFGRKEITVQPTRPGVYVEEVPGGVRAITGVATSIAAFVGRTKKGPVNHPVTLNSFGDFERAFGPLTGGLTLGFAVRDFFRNGGSHAIVVRLTGASPAAAAAMLDLPAAVKLPLVAASPGQWGESLQASVDYDTREAVPPGGTRKTFNLAVADQPSSSERFLDVSIDPADARYLPRVLEDGSHLVRVPRTAGGAWAPFTVPDTTAAPVKAVAGSGADGGPLTADDYTLGAESGIFALEKADLFNLLCLPPDDPAGNVPAAVIAQAAAYCEKRRAMLLVDPPVEWTTKQKVMDALRAAGDSLGARSPNAALFFPRVRESNPLHDNRLEDFVPCGAVAGVFARTDAQRGVWKAPAGLDAAFNGVSQLAIQLADAETAELNPLGVNCLRSFPPVGPVVWGSRTLAGAGALAAEYKYIPVRRLALYLEESLYRGLRWVVFEPNGEPLWAQIRLNVGAFLHDLYRQGAFQGATPNAAYFVKCDRETTTQTDLDLGIVNIVIGFAPLKPAEFVIIKLQQQAGQIDR